jgi:hypothetical protein
MLESPWIMKWIEVLSHSKQSSYNKRAICLSNNGILQTKLKAYQESSEMAVGTATIGP